MSKTFKDSPKPLREADPSPIFSMEDDGYVVKAMTPIEHQRASDGTLHSMSRPSGLQNQNLYEDVYRLSKSCSCDKLDADAVIKAFMGKDKDEDDDSDDLKKKKPKLGSGERFKQLSSKLDKKGVEDPKALAAAIGRKKYGKSKFQKLAAKGK
jgi:hypothetical protein